jgi:glycosyltransferase involved in cell wall biosynthesis
LDVIRARRPHLLFVQSPSIVLALLAITIGRVWSSRVVIDAHNAGILPLEGRVPLLNWICRKSLQMADFVLVSNDELRDMMGLGNVLVLADPLLDDIALRDHGFADDPGSEAPGDSVFRVTYVTSWAADEPFMEVIEAARRMPNGIQVRVTGRPPPRVSESTTLPDAVRLLGYLDDAAYLAELRAADAVLVLTTRQACLTCGAYEGLSLEKPLILSATPALRAYFGDAAVYTENTAAGICQAIRTSRGSREEMRRKSVAAKIRVEATWSERLSNVRKILNA